MSGDLVELPVKVEVTPEKFGSVRRVKVVSREDIPPELDTQEWRLKALSVESHVRDQIAVDAIGETTRVGIVRVDPDTLEWEFIEE